MIEIWHTKAKLVYRIHKAFRRSGTHASLATNPQSEPELRKFALLCLKEHQWEFSNREDDELPVDHVKISLEYDFPETDLMESGLGQLAFWIEKTWIFRPPNTVYSKGTIQLRKPRLRELEEKPRSIELGDGWEDVRGRGVLQNNIRLVLDEALRPG